MLYTTFAANGMITGSGACQESQFAEQAALQGAAGVIEGSWSWMTHRIDVTGDEPQAVELGARPSEHHVFDFDSAEWVDPRTLEDRRAAKWVLLKAARDAAEFGGFTWDGSAFDSDPQAQARLQGGAQLATLAAMQSEPFSIDWTLADNAVRTLDGDDMIAVGVALGLHITGVHAQGRDRRAAVWAASTATEIDAITW